MSLIQRCPRGSTIYRGILISGSCNRGVYRSVLISGCWNRGVPLYTEVSSFQGVGIEEFHCIQKCPHFRAVIPTMPTYLSLVPFPFIISRNTTSYF